MRHDATPSLFTDKKMLLFKQSRSRRAVVSVRPIFVFVFNSETLKRVIRDIRIVCNVKESEK